MDIRIEDDKPEL